MRISAYRLQITTNTSATQLCLTFKTTSAAIMSSGLCICQKVLRPFADWAQPLAGNEGPLCGEGNEKGKEKGERDDRKRRRNPQINFWLRPWNRRIYLVRTTRPAVNTSSPIVNAVTNTINTDEPGHTHIHTLIH